MSTPRESPPPTTARRSHRKTRTGCQTCKRRKVKCDEARPSCRNCITRGTECSFAPAASPTPPRTVTKTVCCPCCTGTCHSCTCGVGGGSSRTSQHNANDSHSHDNLTPLPLHLHLNTPPTTSHHHTGPNQGRNPPPSSSSSSSGVPIPLSPSSINLLDLELLHNFTSSTYATLTDDRAVRAIWRGAVVRRAARREFVMRALLAVSAVHTARHRGGGGGNDKDDERARYLAHAAAHHDVASGMAAEACGEIVRGDDGDDDNDEEAMSSSKLRRNKEKQQLKEDLWIFSVLTIYVGLGRLPTATAQEEEVGADEGGRHDRAGEDHECREKGPSSSLPSSTSSSSLSSGGGGLPDWIFLVNGVRQIFYALQSPSSLPSSSSSSSSFADGFGVLAPVIRLGVERWVEARQRPENRRPDLLRDLGARVAAAVSGSAASPASGTSVESGQLLAIYEEAIEMLACQLGVVLGPPPLTAQQQRQQQSGRRAAEGSGRPRQQLDIIDAFVWHFEVADTLMPLVREGRQEALAIFAHSLVVLSALGGQKWLQGWDTFLLSRVWRLLDDEHRTWIEWPMEEIGWVPPY